jgi:hypothetical protein
LSLPFRTLLFTVFRLYGAIMHAAIYDAVNAIDRTHKRYLVRLTGVSHFASEDAAADAAAHAVRVSLDPKFQTALDAQLQLLLATIPEGAAPPFNFGSAPGDYRSTPPDFPKQPQFTNWPRATPFALERANQFRPGPPPALTSDAYSDVFAEVKSLGIAGSTTATPDQVLTGRFWNGAIQNYSNEIAQTAAVAHSLTTAQSARLFALLNLTFADSVIAFYDAKPRLSTQRQIPLIRARMP